ncbi:hypothetical protein D3C72_1389020 [compost metagenome]
MLLRLGDALRHNAGDLDDLHHPPLFIHHRGIGALQPHGLAVFANAFYIIGNGLAVI